MSIIKDVNMNISYIVGVLVGIVIVLFTFCFTKIILKKKGLIKKECYDERQEREKGNGYKLGFFVALVYYLLLMIVQLSGFEIDNGFFTFVGICLSVGVFAIYCIIKNAYFGYNQTPKGVTILLFVIMLTNLFPCIMALIEGKMLRTTGVNIVCVILLLSVIIASMVKNHINNKDSER